MDFFCQENGNEKMYLYVCFDAGLPERYELHDSVRLGFGSSASYMDDCLQIDHPVLEEYQGEIEKQLTGWRYKNCGGQNHTWLNGEPLEENQTMDVYDNDVLRIEKDGALTLIFSRQEDGELEWKRIALNEDFPVVDIHSFSLQETGDEAEAKAEVQELPEDCHHARIRCTQEGWIAEDFHTERGVYVNGLRVIGFQVLKPMDVICAGETLFLFRGDCLLYNHRTLQRKNLVIHIEERVVQNFLKKHVLLKDINLNIQSGNMVLLLGGSGAGKTTFVNAVTGYEKAKAEILDGGENLYENYEKLKYDIAMVPQQDLLRGEDTVRMTLENAAELRMPVFVSEKERAERVNAVLEIFGLLQEKDELVDKLSGGQRKRLSIGVEYISDPSLFILDEPDSGLDGVMARELMERLRKIADQNKIVIVITHTPDRVIDLFDKVIVLAKGNEDHVGHLAFYGSVEEARSFFERETMEEIVRAVTGTGDGGDGLADQYIEAYKKIQSTKEA